MNEQTFQIQNAKGENLQVCMHGSIQPTIILCCHGMLSNKDSTKYSYLAKKLVQNGLTCVRFDFSGRGQSEGNLYDLCLSKQISDLDSLIDYFADKGVEQFGCFGSSMGGTVGILTASHDERIVALVTLAASAHPEDIERRNPQIALQFRQQGYMDSPEGKIGKMFYDDLFAYDVVKGVSLLRIPTYILHGERDEIVPVADADDLASAAQNTRLEIIFEADHRVSNPVQQRDVMNSICDFFVQTLGT